MKSRTTSIPASLTLSLAITLGACSEPVSTAAKPCPCASGYVCCESGVCASDENACAAATGALSAEAQGHWTGYIENIALYWESDALDFTFDVDDAGALRGRIVVGDGPRLPPPPEAHGDLPPIARPFARDPNGSLATSIVIPANGFSYTARNIRWQARRLRFDIDALDPLEGWCALQTPYPYVHDDGQVEYRMAPADLYLRGYDANNKAICALGEGPAATPASCDWLALANGFSCECTASGCAARHGDSFSFDVALRGNEAEGSMSDRTIRLVRESH